MRSDSVAKVAFGRRFKSGQPARFRAIATPGSESTSITLNLLAAVLEVGEQTKVAADGHGRRKEDLGR